MREGKGRVCEAASVSNFICGEDCKAGRIRCNCVLQQQNKINSLLISPHVTKEKKKPFYSLIVVVFDLLERVEIVHEDPELGEVLDFD